MKAKSILFIFVAALSLLACDLIDGGSVNGDDDSVVKPVEKPVFKKRVSDQGTITVGVYVKGKAHDQDAELSVVLPCPCTNEYQEISEVLTDGDVKTGRDTSFRYVVWNEPLSADDVVDDKYVLSFKMTSYTIEVDFSRIKDIHPYDTASQLWKMYTGKSGEYIDPYNETIGRIADNLWQLSGNLVDYARRCYQYVADTYQYLYPNTGIHSLELNLSRGGGDCGNLSAIYISLLRNKGIPARPVVAVRTDKTYHVWSEFYLEKYGWIPVDVTYLNSYKFGDYFGIYPGDCIIMSNDYNLLLDIGENSYEVALLQNYLYLHKGITIYDSFYYVNKAY